MCAYHGNFALSMKVNDLISQLYAVDDKEEYISVKVLVHRKIL